MPTNISMNSEPLIEKKGTFASPATAFARSVLPVPGGPTSSAPFGSFAPIFAYFSGSCRKSTISTSASFASSSPATLANVIPVSFSATIFALDLPKLIVLPPGIPCFCRRRNSIWPIRLNSAIGTTHEIMKFSSGEFCVGIVDSNVTPAVFSRSTRPSSGNAPVLYMPSLPLSSFAMKMICSLSCSSATSLTFLPSIICRNSL